MKREYLNMKNRRQLYPGCDGAEHEKTRTAKKRNIDLQPDFIGNAPNYDKFNGWTAENVLA